MGVSAAPVRPRLSGSWPENRCPMREMGCNSAGTIAVFGLFHGTNLGNEATLESLLVNLLSREPGLRFLCISPPGSSLAGQFELPNQPIETLAVAHYFWRLPDSWLTTSLVNVVRRVTEPIRYRLAKRSLRGIDMLIVPGTGVLGDFGQGPLDMPMSMLRWVRAAKDIGARVVFLSVGAGPIILPASRKRLLRAAKLADSRSFRDAYSRDYMSKIGLNVSSDTIVPDLAFGLPAPSRTGPVSWPPKVIGIGVMSYFGWHEPDYRAQRIYDDYMAKITDFVSWLAGGGYEVRLLIGDTRADPAALQDMEERVGHLPNIVANEIRTSRDLVKELQFTDIVIATRYHNLLLALLAEKPTISISYSNKCDSLMDLVGLRQFRQPIEELDIELLKEQFQRLAAHESAPVDTIRLANRDARKALSTQFDRVIRQLGE